jgi:thiamine biosynthesis lipoprotein
MKTVIDRDTSLAIETLGQVPAWFEEWEQRLSRFRPESELNWINLHAGQEIRVSAVMWAVLQAAQQATRRSNGMVTPAILDALEYAGYDRSFDNLANGDNQERTAPNTGSPALFAGKAYLMNRRRQTITQAPGVRLDLGGVAKGWAADRAAHRLRRIGPALVEAGGDISINGPLRNGDPWPVGVVNPFATDEDLEQVLLYQGGIATSGKNRRRWLRNGHWQHHLIDPASGQPAYTDVLTATVIAPNAQSAELAAKRVVLSGAATGIAWLDRQKELAGLVILDSGEIIPSLRWPNQR